MDEGLIEAAADMLANGAPSRKRRWYWRLAWIAAVVGLIVLAFWAA